jgi:hypothetical protein
VVNGLGIWWRKLGLDGTNVNQLTSQKLTDLGRGPVFYDCLVEVAADRPVDAVPGGVKRKLGHGPRCWGCAGCLAALCLSGCANLGYYWQSVQRPPGS